MAAVDVIEVDQLAGPERAALATLLARVAVAKDEPPLPEPELRAVTEGTGPGRAVLAGHDGGLVGAAFVFPAAAMATGMPWLTGADVLAVPRHRCCGRSLAKNERLA